MDEIIGDSKSVQVSFTKRILTK